KKWKINSNRNIRAPSLPDDHFFIDGNAFVYNIAFRNRTHWTHGGQYATLADVVTKIVHRLQKAHIQLTFLFDGALPSDKIETRIKRHRSYIERCASTYYNLKQINTSNKNSTNVSVNQHSFNDYSDMDGIHYHGDLYLIPPLTLEVVIQTLRVLDAVEVKICKAEADGEVVAMAVEASKKQNAYVISQDSDMFVYPLVGSGYIPLDMLNIPLDQDVDDQFISARVFQAKKLANLLNLKHTYLLPLFATLMGNDYLDMNLIKFPITQWYHDKGLQHVTQCLGSWPKVIAEFINRILKLCDQQREELDLIRRIVDELKPIISRSNMKAREEFAESFEDRLLRSISQYDAQSPFLSDSVKRSNSGNEIADLNEIITKYLNDHKNYVSRHLLDIIGSRTFWCSIFLEDVEKESVWKISNTLREAIYRTVNERFFNNSKDFIVNEYIRVKQHLEMFEIEVTNDCIAATDSKEILCHLHKTHVDHLKPFDAVLHPLILCLRYMVHHYPFSPFSSSTSTETRERMTDYEVVGVVIATLKSLGPLLAGFSITNPSLSRVPSLKKRYIHLASQFQTIIYSSYLLSLVLEIPGYLQHSHVLSHMYNGLYFHHYIEMAKGGASIAKMLDISIGDSSLTTAAISADFANLFGSVYKAVTDGLENDIEATFEYNLTKTIQNTWIIPSQKPKRLNPSLLPSKSKSNNGIYDSYNLTTKKKKKTSNSSVNNNGRNVNAFNVLSFGCNFDD
ncbi:hypothetical protein BDF20DRAFT_858674, partial [Mycotypha africana]|uniref:uncharacterized protein n=1 Tax=Mycotypha africana TaxID=64632 RepID=UPI0022FFF66A